MYANNHKNQIDALTSTRAIAAFLVFVHHFGTGIFPFAKALHFFSSGNIAVGYFFVLSGFVLYLNYAGKKIEYQKYLISRLGRILPLYIVGLIASIAILKVHYDYQLLSSQSLKEIGLSLFLLQAYVPEYALTLNVPGWTISIEVFFYVVFPLLLSLLIRHRNIFILSAIALYSISQFLHLYWEVNSSEVSSSLHSFLYFNPIIHLSEFLAGMIGGVVYFQFRKKGLRWNILSCLLGCLAFILIALRPDQLSFQVGLLAPIFMLLVISLACSNPPILRLKWLVFAGDISYGFYILQLPVFRILGILNGRYMHLVPALLFWVVFVVLILISIAAYRWIEHPVRQRVRRFVVGEDVKL